MTSTDRYAVRYICDTSLPEGVDWVFVTINGSLTLCIKHSAVTPRTLADAWAAYRAMNRPHRRRLLPDRPLSGAVAPAALWLGVLMLLGVAGWALLDNNVLLASFWGNAACALSAFAAVAHLRWRGIEALEQSRAEPVDDDEPLPRRHVHLVS